MSKKTKRRGRVFAKRLKDAEAKGYSEGYDQGKKDGESITRYRGVRGLWQMRIHSGDPVLRIKGARMLEACQSYSYNHGFTKEMAELDARRRLAGEIARMATVEHYDKMGVRAVYARISIASVERAELPPMKYPFASEPHDSRMLEWHAFREGSHEHQETTDARAHRMAAGEEAGDQRGQGREPETGEGAEAGTEY